MDEQKLIENLTNLNVWWNNNPVPDSIKKADLKRKVFYNLSDECLKDKNICCISGPRQVGKTTLMGQLIEHQINVDKIDPKRIAYFLIDSELLRLYSDNVLIDSLKVYFDYVLGESPGTLKSKVYIYLDEIQSLEGWAKQLKTYFDTYSNIKFIISGSSETKLRGDAADSLVGRIQFRLVLPFKFMEFLEFDYKDKMPRDLEFAPVNLREVLKQSMKEKTPKQLYSRLIRLKVNISQEIPRIKKLLNMYMIKGGYPGLLPFGEDYPKAMEKLKTDLELTVYKDIHKMFKTRNSSDLMTLLTLMADSCGQKINYSRLASAIGIDRRVVNNYLNYISKIYLTSESKIYKNSKYRQAEKSNKAYMIDVGHRNALLGKMNELALQESSSGLLIQNVVYNHSSKLRFFLSGYTEHEIFYWEDGKDEIDVILDIPIFVLPIEVKSRRGDKGVAGIKKFLNISKKAKWGMIITLDELKLEDNVLFMPLWAYLLMC